MISQPASSSQAGNEPVPDSLQPLSTGGHEIKELTGDAQSASAPSKGHAVASGEGSGRTTGKGNSGLGIFDNLVSDSGDPSNNDSSLSNTNVHEPNDSASSNNSRQAHEAPHEAQASEMAIARQVVVNQIFSGGEVIMRLRYPYPFCR